MDDHADQIAELRQDQAFLREDVDELKLQVQTLRE